MMDVLFVHGTGVRLHSYDKALSLVRKQAATFLNGAHVHQCLWGDPLGARLNAAGASVPTYHDTPAHNQSKLEAEQIEQASWRMLAEDPLFELRLLENLPASKREMGPNETPPGTVSLKLIQELDPPAEFFNLLRNKDLETAWTAAREIFVRRLQLTQILHSVNRDPREISQALARALVASMISTGVEDGHPQVSAATRTQFVDLLIPYLGGRPLLPFDWITKPLSGIAKRIGSRIGTSKGRRERHALTDATFPGAGDIVLYQARGDSIRAFIRDRIIECEDDLIVIAHSLGGIALVDLLVEKDLSHHVKGLVTVGSQAPFLYEIDALVSLRFGKSLPPHFPTKWLNIWDPNDFLSYIGEGVFGSHGIKDFMVESGLSFPDSHSAYWDQTEVWNEIRGLFYSQ